MTKKKIDNDNDKIYSIIIFIIILILTPSIWLAMIFGKFLSSIFISKNPVKKSNLNKNRIQKILINLLIISIYTMACIIFWFLTKGYNNKIVSWYDYLAPLIFVTKILINIKYGLNALQISSILLVCSIFPSIIFMIIFVLFRNFVIENHKKSIEHYLKKLQKEEIAKDPRKEISFIKMIWFWLLSINPRENIKKNINKSKYVMLNKNCGIVRKNLNRHLAIMGTTGSGKTQTLYKFLDDGLKNNKGIIFVDGKGDEIDLFKMRKLAEINNKKFYAFTIDGETIKNKKYNKPIKTTPYNPFSSRKKGIITDMIMSCFVFTEEHYKAAARTFFEILIETLLALDIKISWDTILYNLDIDKVITLLQKRYKIGKYAHNVNLKKDEIIINSEKKDISEEKSKNQKAYNIALKQIQNVDKRGVTGFSSRLGMIYQTTKETIVEFGITLKQIFEEQAFIYFSLNATDYAELAPMIGKLIINDIKASAEVNSNLNTKTIIALDEFNVFANDNVIDILNKGRSKGFEVILAYQSLSDLAKISNEFMKQIIENTNNKIIQATNDPDWANYLASLMGTRKEHKKTYAVEDNDETGRESVRVVDSFRAHPNEIKELALGEAFVKFLNEDNVPEVIEKKIKIEIPKEILDL